MYKFKKASVSAASIDSTKPGVWYGQIRVWALNLILLFIANSIMYLHILKLKSATFADLAIPIILHPFSLDSRSYYSGPIAR